MKFKGKNVWITGASSGIGEALAYAFAKEGADLILSARNINKLEEVRKNCPANTAVVIAPLDLAKHEELPEIVKNVLQQTNKIDILINNGGISQRSLAIETDFEVDKQLINVNYLGTIALTKALLPHFIQNNAGYFVVISSLVGKFGSPLRSTYAASKHALHGFFDSLRAELKAYNIPITIVCPGFIRTNISINALTADGKKQNKMDDAQANGMTTERFSHCVLKAILREKEEVNIGGKETLTVWVKRFFPRIFSKIIKNAKVT